MANQIGENRPKEVLTQPIMNFLARKLERIVKGCLVIGAFLATPITLGCLAAVVAWVFELHQEYKLHFWIAYAASSIPMALECMIDECENTGGLSLGDIIFALFFSLICTPFLVVFGGICLSEELQKKWFPVPPKAPGYEKPKRILIRCGRKK